MNRWVAVIAVGVSVFGIGGCGSSNDSATVSTSSKSPSATAPPTTALKKTVGQDAGYACSDPSAQSCSVDFTVTEITAVDCPRSTTIKPDERVVRVSLDVEVNSQVPGTNANTLFLITDNWRARSRDGYITKIDSTWCGDDMQKGALNDARLQVGDKARGSENFVIPKDAVALVLRTENSPGWEWAIPAR